MGTYNFVEHTADIALQIHADNLTELFQLAAKGFKEVVADQIQFENLLSNELYFEAQSIEELLVDFLSELNFLLQTKEWLIKSIDYLALTVNDEYSLTATLSFGDIKNELEILKAEIKAVTYHNLRIENTGSGFTTTIIFDI